MQTCTPKHRRRERGMTLAEALIAVLVFAVVFLAALMLYNTANRAYIATDSATIQQQNARFAIDRMLNTLRNAGASYNVTGSRTIPDEQIENADTAAVFVRGDFDNARENVTPNLENAAHPYVTVGNDEIVGYILRKPGGDAANTVQIAMSFDTTVTGGRDATMTTAGVISNENPVTVRAAAKSVADETNPPYQLTRVTFNDSGTPQYEVIADNIFRLEFGYTKKDGTALASASAGGADAQRAERALVRKIDVKLITMAERPDFNYTDPNTYTPVESAPTKRYRKFSLTEFVAAPNLGIVGSRHSPMPAVDIAAPASLTVCTGHDRNFYLFWPATSTAGISNYEVTVTGSSPTVSDSFLAGTTNATYKAVSDTQALTFSVKGVSGAYDGAESVSVAKAPTHDTTNSIPSLVQNVAASGTSGLNEMTVRWDPVTTSINPISGSTCLTQPGGATSAIPTSVSWRSEAPDLKEYHVYRKLLTPSNGATGAFTVTDTNPPSGSRVDNFTIAGFTNTTPTNNVFPDKSAAPCGRYFYKSIAFDSGGLPTTLGTGSAAMSAAAFYIPAAGIKPQKPAAPSPIGTIPAASGTPPTWNNVRLQWPFVTRDSTTAPAFTAHYQLIRDRSVGGGAWVADLTRDYYEENQMASPGDTLVATSASYRYSVKAIYDCQDVSDTIRFDTSDYYYLTCTFTPTINATGTSIGQGTQADPWELDYPDYVSVAAPSGSTIQSVDFTLKEDNSGDVIVPTYTDSVGPFEFGYNNQQDGTIYRLEITATSTAGCTYTDRKYIRDAPPVPACLFGTSARTGPVLTLDLSGSRCPSGTPGGVNGEHGGNKLGTAQWTYTVPNSSPVDNLTLKQVQITWAPDANHSDAKLKTISFISGTTTASITSITANTPPSSGLLPVPTTAPVVPFNTSTYQMKVQFEYNACDLDMTTAPITKICLVYTSATTGTQQRFCNLVGAATTGTSNPNSCD